MTPRPPYWDPRRFRRSSADKAARYPAVLYGSQFIRLEPRRADH